MHFRKSLQHANFKKTHAVGAEHIYADGLTDMIKLIDAFHHYSKAINNIFPSTCPFLFQILNVVTSFNSFQPTQDTVCLQPQSHLQLFGTGKFDNKYSSALSDNTNYALQCRGICI